MSVSSTLISFSYIADGVSVNFAFPSYFCAQADLLVQYIDNLGNVTNKTLNSDYTITGTLDPGGLGTYSGGAVVVFGTPPIAGGTVQITRQTPITQPAVYAEYDAFPAKTHEAALDRACLINQELAAGITRG